MTEQVDVDFALAAFRDTGEWRVAELAHDLLDDVETVADALRRFPGESGLALIALDEDYFVIVRASGDRTRLLLSDTTAAEDWDLAASALEFLGLPAVDLAEGAEQDETPAGDLALLADLGLPETEMAELLDDVELYTDEMLAEVAEVLGFGELFDDVVGLTSA